jgi:hypothetical protein
MLEGIVVFLLARHNGQVVAAKGVKPTMYQWGTVGLWFGLEIAGFFVGLLFLGRGTSFFALYVCAITGAIAGALLSTYWAGQVPAAPYSPFIADPSWRPTHVAPASGLPGWPIPDASQVPSTMIPPGAPLAVSGRHGDWARVTGPQGWSGWVDARQLEPAPIAQGYTR